MAEYKCLPGVMEKCPDCDGPECSYSPGGQCEKDNLAYLAPDVRAELESFRVTGLTPQAASQLKQIAEIFNCDPNAPAQLKQLCNKLRYWRQAGRLVVLPEDKARWLKAILDERERQDQKWGFPQENTYGEWGSILAEEAGELCKELNELNFGRGDPGKMEMKAVQVAAVALSILEHVAVALGVTEQVAKVLHRVATRPKCFYGDSDLCRGMSVNNDDEPIEACKRCWYCSAGYRQLEAEAAGRREKEAGNG